MAADQASVRAERVGNWLGGIATPSDLGSICGRVRQMDTSRIPWDCISTIRLLRDRPMDLFRKLDLRSWEQSGFAGGHDQQGVLSSSDPPLVECPSEALGLLDRFRDSTDSPLDQWDPTYDPHVDSPGPCGSDGDGRVGTGIMVDYPGCEVS